MADPITNAIAGAQGTATAAAKKTSDRAMIAENFDAFLLLLTTQLKNQSPLDPMDTNQFTEQLVQFASVEQQLKSNDTLNALLTSARGSTVSTAASFVGMQVTADGTSSRLANGKAEWMINPARNAQANVIVMDKNGSVVATSTQAVPAGAQKFVWDGKTNTDTTAPPGDYTIHVSARDAAGQNVPVKTEILGLVQSVDMSSGEPMLVVGPNQVPLDKVRSITWPAPK
jgi:flagellar basal-body rod modification protein FlgD